ncbi:MAG: ATP-binding protein [Planctomycetaceae bacterium]|nr:ATP-binding protein [Planctomycetaceae bacterium]MBT6919247.1 ATP-binding protein [Planctomycetaceae bacterium]
MLTLSRLKILSDTTALLQTLVMRWTALYQTVALFFFITAVATPAEPTPPRPWTTTSLEKKLTAIDGELQLLAHPRLLSGIGPIGYRSESHNTAGHHEWVEVTFDGEKTINEIILVPSLYNTPDSTVQSDGFPEEFTIWAINDTKGTRTLLASFTTEDQVLPRKSPLSVPCKQAIATGVRLEATSLSQRAWDDRYVLQFSELLVFCGQENVALHSTVSYSSSENSPEGARNPQFLVDGVVPYVMDANAGIRSTAFYTNVPTDPASYIDNNTCHIDINLGKPTLINGMYLHATDVSDNVPQAHPNKFGLPRQLKVLGANTVDFADAQPLSEYRLRTAFDAGPILGLRFPPVECQFIRMIILEPDQVPGDTLGCIGLAEIECLSEGKNVAVSSEVTTNLKPELIARRDRLPAITDGNNYYGEILPTRAWLRQLARRHDLETQRPIIQTALKTAYQGQRATLESLFWLSCLLAAIIVAIAIAQRLLKQRTIYRTREQIAADLHDELGANLHAISLCSDIAYTKIHDPEQLSPLFQRIRELAHRSGTAAKSCVNLLESEGLYEGLEADIKRISERLLNDIEYTFHLTGEDNLESLDPKTQIGIALFFKECLANVIRHSGATLVSTHLEANPRDLVLTVIDNGIGLQTKDNGIARTSPASLLRRARLLRGTVVTTDMPEGGTRVTLRTKTKPHWF